MSLQATILTCQSAQRRGHMDVLLTFMQLAGRTSDKLHPSFLDKLVRHLFLALSCASAWLTYSPRLFGLVRETPRPTDTAGELAQWADATSLFAYFEGLGEWTIERTWPEGLLDALSGAIFIVLIATVVAAYRSAVGRNKADGYLLALLFILVGLNAQLGQPVYAATVTAMIAVVLLALVVAAVKKLLGVVYYSFGIADALGLLILWALAIIMYPILVLAAAFTARPEAQQTTHP
jgi:hypothetical protein